MLSLQSVYILAASYEPAESLDRSFKGKQFFDYQKNVCVLFFACLFFFYCGFAEALAKGDNYLTHFQ